MRYNVKSIYYFPMFISLAIFCVIIILWLTGTIHTISPRINYLIFGISLLIPPICLFITLILDHQRKKLLIIFLSILSFLAIFIFLVWLFVITILLSDVLLKDVDPSFELIKTEKIDNRYIRVYRTNGGATTAYGIVVREEIQLFPGIYFVKIIDSKDHAYEAEIIINEQKDIDIIYYP